MKAREIMIRDVKSLFPDMTSREALSLLQKMAISGLPVVDEQGKLVGMFTEKEILAYTLPSYINKVGSFVYEENPKSTRKKLGELDKIKVSQLMRKEVVSITEETTLCEVARIMLTQKARRLPVVDKAGKVVGIIARSDVLAAFMKEKEVGAIK